MAFDRQGILKEVLSGLPGGNGYSNDASEKSGSDGGLSGIRGLAPAAGMAGLAPVAVQTAGKRASGLGVESLLDLVNPPGDALGGAPSKLGDRVTTRATDKALGG